MLKQTIYTVKVLKFQTLYSILFWFKFCILCSLNQTKLLNGMANSVDPDQTAPSGAVWSGSALFALFAYGILSEILMFEILGHLPYPKFFCRQVQDNSVVSDQMLHSTELWKWSSCRAFYV